MPLFQTSEYALRAVLYIAAHERAVQVGEIASAVGIPRNYLSKTLHRLARAGVLASTRGPSGGFRLAVAPEQLTLDGIIAPFADGREDRCLLGRGTCGEVVDCPVHARWHPVASQLRQFFATTTVAALLAPPSPDP